MLKRIVDGNQKQIIEYETDEGVYSTMRTLKITTDSAWLNYNGFQTKDYRFIDRITDAKFYNTDTSIVSLDMLKKMIEDGKVKAVYSQ